MPPTIPYRAFGAFRLLLALLVFTQHALQPIAPIWLKDALAPLEVGTVAVMMFFALSGFIVSEAALEFYSARPGAFLINRMLRIYPSYLIALVITVALALSLDAAGMHDVLRNHLVAYPTFSASEFVANSVAILPGGKTILDRAGAMPLIDVAWALRVELAFYGVLFLILSAARLTGSLPKYWMAGAGAAATLLWCFVHNPVHSGFFEFAPLFVLGSALYMADTAHSTRGRRFAGLLALIAGVESVLTMYDRPAITILTTYVRDIDGQLILFGVLSALWLALAWWPGKSLSPRDKAWDQFAGELTYPLYLLHTVGSTIVNAFLPNPSGLTFVLALLASLGAATAATLTYEAAIGRLRAGVRGFRL